MVIAEQKSTPVGRRSRYLVVATVAVLVFGVVIARWLTTPFDDWVPLVVPDDLPAEINPDDLPVSAHFRCSAPFGESESAVATDQARDALEIQGLAREPCSQTREQHRTVGVLDLAVAAGLLGVIVVVRRHGRPPSG